MLDTSEGNGMPFWAFGVIIGGCLLLLCCCFIIGGFFLWRRSGKDSNAEDPEAKEETNRLHEDDHHSGMDGVEMTHRLHGVETHG